MKCFDLGPFSIPFYSASAKFWFGYLFSLGSEYIMIFLYSYFLECVLNFIMTIFHSAPSTSIGFMFSPTCFFSLIYI
jgi:hypothetical protein